MIAVFLGGKVSVLQKTPFENSPEALSQRARGLVQRFGYTDRAVDRAYFLSRDTEFLRYAQRSETAAVFQAQLAQGQPSPGYFWFRQSPRYLETISADSTVTWTDPPPIVSGMVSCKLDFQGRLIEFQAVPPQVVDSSGPANPTDWTALLAAAGLEAARFSAAEPKWLPLVSFDSRMAWTGSLAHAPEVPLRIEAASWRGRPVYFQIIGPWTRPDRMQPRQQSAGERAAQWLTMGCCFRSPPRPSCWPGATAARDAATAAGPGASPAWSWPA